ncbi:filamentous haemagglutinin family protein [Methylomonas sp. AM2-LC]|uniref:filamentous haemagglutinin family protein n=1 Tax=Methylomonas sp. AM2-LC TaxID=3153301 RepID=UPI00326305B9
MHKSILPIAKPPYSQQKPLVIAIRAMLASGFVVGAGVSPVMANGTQNLPTGPVTVSGSATETLSNNGHTLTVDTSKSNHTVLDWSTFNINPGYTVDFHGASAASVVLNNIGDQNASTIYGTITANEQVYLVNHNGIVFEHGSQVNANTLVATSLGISPETLQTGIANVFSSSNPIAALKAQDNGQNYLQDSHGNYILDSNGNQIPITIGDITVQSGATIKTNAVGGLILLAGNKVENDGTVIADHGQVIMAAAQDKVYLQDSKDPNVRGMLVEVGTGGSVTNTGTVLAQTGNVSMIGFAVNQSGVVSATTSVALNGSVRLMAEEGVSTTSTGVLQGLSTQRSVALADGLATNATVTLHDKSITAVELDDSGGRVIAGQTQPKSYIEISAHNVDLLKGSTVQARAGNVNIEAWETPQTLSNANGSFTLPAGNGEIYMEAGSNIDVSGMQNVAESVAENIVSIKLQSNELSNSPLQRNGLLYGQTVYVDTRDASMSYLNGVINAATVPIANIIGSVQNVTSNIAERSTAGGTINLNSSGDVVLNVGSTLNFSGGSIAYQSGYVTTTELVSNNQIYSIGTASPNLIYTGISNHTVYESGYVQGAAGGSLNITGYAALLDATLQGHTTTGAEQRQSSSWAAGSNVNITLESTTLAQQDVVFSQTNSGLTLDVSNQLPLQGTTSNPVALNLNASMLNNSGVQNLTLNTTGQLTINAGTHLVLPDAGKLNLTASNFTVDGSIVAPSGTVNLNYTPTQVNGVTPSGEINFGSDASINVSGVWINDWLDGFQQHALSQVAINGGTVNLTGGSINLAAGSSILANGGAWEKNTGAVTGGKGGAISLNAGGEFATLTLNGNGQLSAFGLTQNGSLAIQADQIVIGDQLPVNNSGHPLLLGTDFFKSGGFSSYNLTSTFYGLNVEKNFTLDLQQTNLQLNAAASFAATGTQLTAITTPHQLADSLRTPVNLSLTYAGNYTYNGIEQDLTVGAGALIQTDPLANVTLTSNSSIYVDGTINAPAGNISLNTKIAPIDPGYVASQGIWLGAGSQLLARGAYVSQTNANGLNSGTIYAGGNVSLQATRGSIFTEAEIAATATTPKLSAALIDVSGSSGVSNILQSNGNGIVSVAQKTPSAGGVISLVSGEGIYADGTLKAQSGGGNAAGGSLLVNINSVLINPATSGAAASGYPNLPSLLYLTTSDANNAPLEGHAVNSAMADQAWLKTSVLNTGGFASLTLKTDAQRTNTLTSNAIIFDGNVDLVASQQIILDSPMLQTDAANQQITLEAPYVALGSSLVNNGAIASNILAAAATGGTGHLTVKDGLGYAQGIDLIGGLSFNGFNQVTLNSQGDVRMRGDLDPEYHNQQYLGELNLIGNLTINAKRIYPATLTDYTINVSQTVTFGSTGTDTSPLLTAGGNLTVNAADIYQQTNLEVPFGTLSLNASDILDLQAGSVTSVSGLGTVVPFGVGSGGSLWEYPLNANGQHNLVIYDKGTNNLPQKLLELTGNTVNLETGATLNLQGGGNLYAYEFIAGAGGSTDVLNTTVSNQFAVVPGIDNILTPYDPQQYSSSGLTAMGQSVYLNAASGLAAGWYTILPAHYALLPGAYLITPEAGTLGQTQTTTNSAGASIVAGYYGVAGTTIQNALSQGFEVQSGSIFTGSLSYNANGNLVTNTNVNTPSQFNAYLASTSIASMAAQFGNSVPQLPQDGGGLQLAAAAALTLDATLLAGPAANGLGGQVDISANKLEVVGSAQDLPTLPSGTVGLLVSQLNTFNAPSLLLGGKRNFNNGEVLTTTAQTVTVLGDVKNDNALQGQEILLAATDLVKVESGAQVSSTGAATGVAAGTIRVENSDGTSSDGALLRVSSAGQVVVNRNLPLTGTGGVLEVDQGATLLAKGSMLLDATQNTIFKGSIDANSGGALTLDSSRISLGDIHASRPGLVLASLPSNFSDLVLNSRGNLDIYGSFNFGAKNVSISAADINGFGNNGKTSTITATGQLNVSNSNGAVSLYHSDTTPKSGSLVLKAEDIQLGSGNYAITGFDNVTMTATHAINGQGAAINTATGTSSTAAPAVLSVAGNLLMTAAHFSGGNGATTTINTGNYDVTLQSPASNNTAALSTGLGVSWTINAAEIDSGSAPPLPSANSTQIVNGARFDLPSGSLNLNASKGDINLYTGTAIDLSGRSVTFANANKYTPGGNLTLVANAGTVNVQNGTSVNLAGAVQVNNGVKQQVSNAGSLNVQAAVFNWNGVIDATGGSSVLASGVNAGNLQMNVQSFDNFKDDTLVGFSALNSLAYKAGFRNKLILEQQQGDVSIATKDVVNANLFQLLADQGSVTIDGSINASGVTAGNVSIYGENGITLAGSINAYATGVGNAGGSVTLDSVARNGNDAGNGQLDLSAHSGSINVAAGAGGTGGSVLLRTGRNDTNDTVSVTAINTQISGTATGAKLEATRVYADINSGTENANIITADNINQWQSDTASFMANAPELVNNSGSLVELMPGIEVRSSGSLALASTAPWDFSGSGWRYGSTQSLPGFLTLRAVGDLDVQASISDGVVNNSIQSGSSWSYDLIAGGSINLASSYYDANNVDTQLVVRTGTGAIQMQSGKDINFNIDTSGNLGVSDDASAVYTVGSSAQLSTSSTIQQIRAAFPDLPAPTDANETTLAYLNSLTPAQQNQVLEYGLLPVSGVGGIYPLAQSPTQGGNISLQAGGNIQGQQTGEQISNWLVTGGYKLTGTTFTYWGINLSGGNTSADANNHNFNQNVGALGGGNVTIQAGANINDLSVMIPNTAKPLGSVASYGRQNAINWTDSTAYVNGGGTLQVTAGNDIVAGQYYVASAAASQGVASLGVANLVSGGSFATDTNNPTSTSIGTILDVGNAVFTLQARNDLNLETALNPTVIVPSKTKATTSAFFSYGTDSAVNLQSIAGNVTLLNDNTAIQTMENLATNGNDPVELTDYPGILSAVAFAGDINIDNSMNLFPSANGSLQLLANGNIGIDPSAPILSTGNVLTITMSDVNPDLIANVQNPVGSFTGATLQNYLNAYNIVFGGTSNLTASQLIAPGSQKPALIVANTGNIAFPSALDASINLPTSANIIAGGNINDFTVALQNQSANDVSLIQASNSINFDTSYDNNGFQTQKSPSPGITIAGPGELQVLAGKNINLGNSQGIDSIGNIYNPALSAAGATIDVFAGVSGQIDYAGFIKAYENQSAYSAELQGLDPLQPQKDLGKLLNVMFQEIRLSSSAAAAAPENQRYALYQQGFDAIHTLFPSATYSGSLNMVFSQITTEMGGDINLVTPGGGINVGLAGAESGNQKTADQLGILVQQQGALNILTQGDMNVNQSRVFTEGGGAVTAWSSQGSIDAGNGARSALAAAQATTVVSPDGQTTTSFSPTIAGSGIQAVGGGNVYLAAPFGVVNAGEAGISGNDIVIAATAVVGASNISASGSTSGVPTAVVSPPVTGADGAAAAVTKSSAATSLADNNSNNDSADTKQKNTVSILTTDVVGYGKCSVGDVKSGVNGCGS